MGGKKDQKEQFALIGGGTRRKGHQLGQEVLFGQKRDGGVRLSEDSA